MGIDWCLDVGEGRRRWERWGRGKGRHRWKEGERGEEGERDREGERERGREEGGGYDWRRYMLYEIFDGWGPNT